MSNNVQVVKSPPVGRIVLSRPEKRNAMTTEMVRAVADGCRELDADADTDVIVLSGEGAAFSAGGDLREKGRSTYSFQDAWEILASGHDLVQSIETASKVVIARVHGHAHAGGLLLALSADITIAGESARFRVPELLRARPDPFIPPRLIAKVGRERAAELMFTAREIDGHEAYRIGLVSRCVPDTILDDEVDSMVKAIAATDRNSRAVWKRLLVQTRSPVDPWTFSPAFATAETAGRSYSFTG
jgi:enoyl-CoA hydratase/carnithine racemase